MNGVEQPEQARTPGYFLGCLVVALVAAAVVSLAAWVIVWAWTGIAAMLG